jgi:hypothetical protein
MTGKDVKTASSGWQEKTQKPYHQDDRKRCKNRILRMTGKDAETVSSG